MDNKDKIIEEMAKDLEPFITLHREVYVSANRKERHGWMLSEEDNKVIAEELIKKGYRKLPKDSVVLTKGEWKQIKSSLYYSKEELEKKLQKARKETAEKILNMIYWKAVKHIKGKNKADCFIEISFEKLDELAKQFGVEIKE